MSQQDVGSVKSHTLSAEAENLRLDIKEMVNKAIPASKDVMSEPPNDVTFFNEDEDGTRAYGGKLLDKKVSELVTGMNLEGVSTCDIVQATQFSRYDSDGHGVWPLIITLDLYLTNTAVCGLCRCLRTQLSILEDPCTKDLEFSYRVALP